MNLKKAFTDHYTEYTWYYTNTHKNIPTGIHMFIHNDGNQTARPYTLQSRNPEDNIISHVVNRSILHQETEETNIVAKL
jgi:hypothetical protein